MVQKQMNLGSVLALFLQVLYNIVQFSFSDFLNALREQPTIMLIVIVGANGAFGILQVYFHLDPKEIDIIIQGIKNIAKDNCCKVLTPEQISAIETEGSYWIMKLVKYLTNLRENKKVDKNG